ncbi:putative ribonuclease H protein At1g65750 family [Senna tora]|uniref:Putative ribonuclease H protein At1g65750 family n=1 Tax=Senna tora TaxID=362788 RepID=A0A834TRT4_9FABA|nr:putative ribonuclease H protein At1g65750 family [Senna tora]
MHGRRVVRCGSDLIPKDKKRCDGSYVWSGICNVWSKVELGTRWIIGDGNYTKFWRDRWVPNCPLLMDVIVNHPDMRNLDEVVCDYVSDGLWDIGKLRCWFDEDTIKKIVVVPVPVSEAGADKVTWRLNSNGRFSVSSAYFMENEQGSEVESKFWRMVWRWHGPQKFKSFLWLFSKDKLYTNLCRFSRRVSGDLLCPRCNLHSKSSLHAIRDCEGIRSLWLSLRNKFVFEGNRGDLNKLYWDILLRSREISNVWKGEGANQKKEGAKVSTKIVSWEPPSPRWCKLNVDGSVKEDGLASCGGVLRDCSGAWLQGFICNIGTCRVVDSELRGILEGLNVAWNHGCRKVCIETDSQLAVNMVANGVEETHCATPLVERIRRYLKRRWIVEIMHIYREANKVADFLAVSGHGAPLGLQLLASPPSEAGG